MKRGEDDPRRTPRTTKGSYASCIAGDEALDAVSLEPVDTPTLVFFVLFVDQVFPGHFSLRRGVPLNADVT